MSRHKVTINYCLLIEPPRRPSFGGWKRFMDMTTPCRSKEGIESCLMRRQYHDHLCLRHPIYILHSHIGTLHLRLYTRNDNAGSSRLLSCTNLCQRSSSTLLFLVNVSKTNSRPERLALPGFVDNTVKLIHLVNMLANYSSAKDQSKDYSYLLQRQSLGFVNHEPHECDADKAEAAPNEENLRLKIGVFGVHHVWCRVGNREVEKPVAGGGHGQSLGTDFEREQLSCYDPGHRSPGRCEEKDVDADESDCSLLGSQVFEGGHCTGDGDDELAGGHTSRGQYSSLNLTAPQDILEKDGVKLTR